MIQVAPYFTPAQYVWEFVSHTFMMQCVILLFAQCFSLRGKNLHFIAVLIYIYLVMSESYIYLMMSIFIQYRSIRIIFSMKYLFM